MKCKNCGNSIPDQSTFCPYCGASLGQTQTQLSADASQFTAPSPSSAQQPVSLSAKAKGKVRICPKCGTLLGKKEKVCSVCGEIMPKPQKSHKAKTAIISMSVVICLLLCSTVYFMLEMFQGNRAIDELTAEVTSMHNQLDFYEQYVAVIDADRYHYHSYDCPELELPPLHIHTFINKKTAKDQGYFPCPNCQ